MRYDKIDIRSLKENLKQLIKKLNNNISKKKEKLSLEEKELSQIKLNQIEKILIYLFDNKMYEDYFQKYFGSSNPTIPYTKNYNTNELDRNISRNSTNLSNLKRSIKVQKDKISKIKSKSDSLHDSDLLDEEDNKLLSEIRENINEIKKLNETFNIKVNEYDKEYEKYKFVYKYLQKIGYGKPYYNHKFLISYIDKILADKFYFSKNIENRELLLELREKVSLEIVELKEQEKLILKKAEKNKKSFEFQNGLLEQEEILNQLNNESTEIINQLDKCKQEKEKYMTNFISNFIKKFLSTDDYDVIINDKDNPLYSDQQFKNKKISRDLIISNTIEEINTMTKIKERFNNILSDINTLKIKNLIEDKQFKKDLKTLKTLNIITEENVQNFNKDKKYFEYAFDTKINIDDALILNVILNNLFNKNNYNYEYYDNYKEYLKEMEEINNMPKFGYTPNSHSSRSYHSNDDDNNFSNNSSYNDLNDLVSGIFKNTNFSSGGGFGGGDSSSDDSFGGGNSSSNDGFGGGGFHTGGGF